MRRTLPIRACALAALGLAPLNLPASDAEFFERRVRPALADYCHDCHSGRSEPVRSGLRVDTLEGLLTGGDRGPALVPGQPDQSLLYLAISHEHDDLAMPWKRPQLPESTRRDIRRWIEQGAPWPAGSSEAAASPTFDLHGRKARLPWIWQPPKLHPAPDVHDRAWPRSDVDRFILARLEEARLSPAPDADDRTWLRRVHFALTGLPPAPETLRGFLDDRSGRRREQVVEQLLASPHFGERWARHWMDLVRYAESRGHESDFIIANAYQYRDYLIRAFNEDVPYDQLVREHVAGDLLPQPRLNPATGGNESVLGTGWVFLGEENHSPVDIRQDECERIDNKVDVFSKTFLGLTLACARCHDHKFDALQARDYYAMAGFFLSSSYRQVRFETMEHNRRIAEELTRLRREFGPRVAREMAQRLRTDAADLALYLEAAARGLAVPPPDRSAWKKETAHLERLDASRLERWIDYLEEAAQSDEDPFQPVARRVAILARHDAMPAEAASGHPSSGVGGGFLPSGARIIADYREGTGQPWRVSGPAFGPGPRKRGEVILGSTLEKPLQGLMPYGAACRDLFWKELRNAPGNQSDAGAQAATARAGQMLRTRTFTLEFGKVHYLIRGEGKVYAGVDSHIMIAGPLHGGLVRDLGAGDTPGPRWVTHDLTAYRGHRAHIEFGPSGESALEVLMVVESGERPADWPPLRWPLAGRNQETLRAFCRSVQSSVEAALEALARQENLEASATIVPVNWLLAQPELFGSERRCGKEAEAYLAQRKALKDRVRWESRTGVAWMDGSGVDEHVLLRGKPGTPGELAPRGLPEAIPGFPRITSAATSGRLALARQLTDPSHPLVARVLVNRVWHHLFGRGLVATVDNFGYLGRRPTHPELLDHLAWTFVHEEGWSIKRLIRKLVLTRSYAMGSTAADPARSREWDPSNELLHRMPVRRLEAEAIRDALLAVSGRLDPRLHGEPVPVHLNDFMVGRGRPGQSGPLDGEGRRSLYTAVRRNFIPVRMVTFDRPTPFTTRGRRNVTNVPAQALVLMNDELFHQQAGVWAERLLRETPGAAPAARLRVLFEEAYAREPDPVEVDACLKTLAMLRTEHGEAPLEVWRHLCHALLNANEFIYIQ